MKLRTGDPWIPAGEYAHSLSGLSVNLLVKDVERALEFQEAVLGAAVIYRDPDFAVLHGFGAEWMLHADHTYEDHPMIQEMATTDRRGQGLELRLHGCDPDKAVAAARKLNFRVLVGAMDKPHGLREAYILDSDGYIWVADIPI
jgi:catechol 2,3-dioxygenase-like lactoylglutathione lyase family enzyme